MKWVLFFVFLFLTGFSQAQKKPLDHSAYDGWKSLGEFGISNDGKYVVYTVNPQEGDGVLVVKAVEGDYQKEFPRGYNALITQDSRHVIFLIRPYFRETREAKIKKKKTEEFPKDSLCILELGKDSSYKVAGVQSFRIPGKGNGQWVAWLHAKTGPSARPAIPADSATRLNYLSRSADSLARMADSLRNLVQQARLKGMTILQQNPGQEKGSPKPNAEPVIEGTLLVWKNLLTGEERKFERTVEYAFSEKGNALLVETSRKNNDSIVKAFILWVNTTTGRVDSVMRQFNDAKNYAFDEEGSQLAFVAERDSLPKALDRFYGLWYFKPGMDSAILKADRFTGVAEKGLTISPDFENRFSKNGKRLYFGLAPIRPHKDTALVEFETSRFDLWHYNDDYLQPQQLVQLQRELKRSYTAVWDMALDKTMQLGSEDAENIILSDEGNGAYVLGTSTKGERIPNQWQGFMKQRAWLVSVQNGQRTLVKEPIRATYSISPKGKYVIWYDWTARQYFSRDVNTQKNINISRNIPFPLWDVEDDHPDDPPPYGWGGWMENDQYVLLYDQFDIWLVDPAGLQNPVNLTKGIGRRNKTELRYQSTDPDERFIRKGQVMLLAAFHKTRKYAGYYSLVAGEGKPPSLLQMVPHSFSGLKKAKNADVYLVRRSDIGESELVLARDMMNFRKLTDIAVQQAPYNWLTVELKRWKMLDGKMSEGLLYKPENFDSTKKYPLIFYFYEKDADNLYQYILPQPVRASINIAWFVSNGYLVFDPNIYYRTGQPGEDAYNSVVSAARYLGRFSWVDSTRMGIQGHSWGGYQVSYLVTRTGLFAAAEAGAPVSNMTSAYGGIRWGSGLSREFQYERSQSRIGASLWEKRDLYLRNSPLFAAPNIKTPLLILHNDQDDAVPWYQGIEFFTALRRLKKKTWLVSYNGEPHGIIERKNRKDWSIRLGQFFDHYLKGAPAPKWMEVGIPASLKGIEWGLE